MICRRCSATIDIDARFCPYCGVSLEPRKYTHKPRTRPNGTGTAYKRGKTWTAQVTVGYKAVEKDGKTKARAVYRRKGGFATKRDALAYCPKLKEGDSGSRKAEKPKLTLKQVYDLWSPIHSGRVSKSTMDCYRAAWKYLAPLHALPVSEIDLDDLQECVDECPKGKRTKENIKALAGLLMKYAIPRHQSDINYAEYLHTGNEAKGTHPAFTKEQVEKIRGQIGVTPHAEYVYCLIYTGFRPTEMLQLKKEDYRDGILYGGIKTQAGMNRAVPVSPKIQPYIDQIMQSDCIFLFGKDDGTQMSINYFRDYVFYPVLAAAGIQGVPSKDHPAYYVPYSCRHTFANMLKDAPGSDKDKAGLIGHEDYRTTKKHYQSAELEAFKKIIQAL